MKRRSKSPLPNHEFLKEISINQYLIKMQAGKTGLIYDPRMTQHKSKRAHPEKPQRVKIIMKLLQQRFYFSHPRVEYISTINRVVTDENIRLVHPEKYLKHIVSLWPKTSHRSDITVLDTYFNESTEHCARLAIGGVLDGIDKIMSGEWRNGFACVRPPGHHSGGRHTINGFCVYNNVAIGARYLRQHHNVERVAIVDWDVHHGDGTQHVFQKEKGTMLISIHRYDRGTFYPGTEFGDVRNQGLGAGVGSIVNIPLDFVDQKFKQYSFQSPGDNEYIYLYHRIVQPILKQFKPDFILVSSGFDAARGDPLGGFSVTPNGYYYMTKKLQEFNKPLLVVLEGGYNLQSISLSAEGVMRALLEDQTYPQPISVPENLIRYRCYLPEIMHKQVDMIVEELSKNWPVLTKSQELKDYTAKVKMNAKRQFGIVEASQSSSSSEGEAHEHQSQLSATTQGTSEGHRYNTRSKKKKNQEQVQREEELRQMEKDEKQLQRNMKKIDKNKQAPLDAGKQGSKQKQEVKIQIKKQMPQAAEQDQPSEESVVAQFYFAAGHLQKFKDFSPNNEKVKKITYPQEISFYENMTFEKEFTPKYYGSEGEDCIILQNLLFKQQDPIVVDVKLSRQSRNVALDAQRQEKERKKEERSTTEQYGFRISGYTTPDYKQGGLLEKDDAKTIKILKNVVTLENKQLFCSYLRKLAAALQHSNRHYYGTSILLIKGPLRSEIRWVDFHYWHESNEGPDLEMVKGVKNLLKFIQELEVSS